MTGIDPCPYVVNHEEWAQSLKDQLHELRSLLKKRMATKVDPQTAHGVDCLGRAATLLQTAGITNSELRDCAQRYEVLMLKASTRACVLL